MRAVINASVIDAVLQAPSSKSSMQRALAASLLHKGTSNILHPGNAADDMAALNIIQQLGATAFHKEDMLEIISPGFPHDQLPPAIKLNCGESGLSVRMFTIIAALATSEITITGEGSLLKRPMNFFSEILPQLGVHTELNDGQLPMKIKGPLIPKDITVDGSLSSQFLTGLLFACGAAAKEEITITVNDLKSKPYIDLTLSVMNHFGFKIQHEEYIKFIIPARTTDNQINRSGDQVITYSVEADWSNAAFLLVAGATAGSITMKGLDMNSAQGDKAIMDVLKVCGANIEIGEKNITVSKSPLKCFQFDATDCPDLFPPLAVLAACCKGISIIKGISRLTNKESNRALTLKDIFGKMGISITLEGDEMMITGGKLSNASVSSFNDHRIAMAAAIAGLNAGEIIIDNAEAVNKSYPAFFEDLKKAGGAATLQK